MRHATYLLLAGTLAAPGIARADTVSVTLPQISIAEYKKPYVAGWIEPAAGGAPRNLFLWYALNKSDGEHGIKWLAELRSWWRKSGRLALPADGITGATKGPGTYKVPLPAGLAPGSYSLNVESVRENGSRELVTVPFSVPGAAGRSTGKVELGAVTVSAN